MSCRMTPRLICGFGRLLPLTLLCAPAVIHAQHAEIRNGNVYYADRSGNSRQITSTGADLDARLSFDGKLIIFVRLTRVRATFEEPQDPDPFQREIWLVRPDGTDAKVVFSGPLRLKDGSEYVSFAAPKLAPGNRYAYFWVPMYVTESGLIRLDLSTKETILITTGLRFEIVGSGPYAGDLVVQMLKPVGDGFSRFFWLLTPAGTELGFVGESETDFQTFLHNPNRKVERIRSVRQLKQGQ
jgi:hypothetical protein